MHLRSPLYAILVSAMLGALLGSGLLAAAAPASFAGKNGLIYFDSNRHNEGLQTDIYSMTPRGTQIRRVRALEEDQNQPAVAPNGRDIAFWQWNDGMNPSVWNLEAGSGPPAELASSMWSAGPAFSADGETIAYIEGTGGGPANAPYTGIFTVPADGSGAPAALIEDPEGRVESPAYSDDGTKIVYTQDDGSWEDGADWNIYIADADGTDRAQVTNWPGAEQAPDIRPNGRRIVFAGKRGADAPSSNIEIYSVRTDGSDMRRLTRNRRADADPDYSPNGKRIVWTRRLGENPDIFKMRAHGAKHRPLTRERRLVQAPDWAPKP